MTNNRLWCLLVSAVALPAVLLPAAPVHAASPSYPGGLNRAEAGWCAAVLTRVPLCTAVYMDEARWANSNAVDCATPDPCLNGDEQNAFQHCLWSAIMKLRHGPDTATGFLTRHESESNGDDDSRRDWNNNDLGFMIANIVEDDRAAGESVDDKTAVYNWCMFVVDSDDLDYTDNPNPDPLARR